MSRLAVAMALLAIAATPAHACQYSHRFETFSLAAPALGHAKRLLVYLPPGYDCSDTRYPVFYLNDGHDLFEWNPFAAELESALAPSSRTRSPRARAGMAAGGSTRSLTARSRGATCQR